MKRGHSIENNRPPFEETVVGCMDVVDTRVLSVMSAEFLEPLVKRFVHPEGQAIHSARKPVASVG